MAQAQMKERTDFFDTETQPSQRLANAQEKLARAFERLDFAVEQSMNAPARVELQEDGALRQQYVTLVEDYHTLLQQFETVRTENEQLHTAWHESDQQYQSLKERTDQVSEKLNGSIRQLELILEA